MSSVTSAAGPHFVPSEVERAVVTKAVRRAAEKLGVTHAVLASILGVSASTISRLGTAPLSRPKSIELGLLFVRVYRSLLGVVGSEEDARRWLHNHNHHLEGCPAELIQTVHGLIRTLTYLDAMRARV